jgi:hypothetical protein
MKHFCNSWRVRNLRVMVLRLMISLNLAESMVILQSRLLRRSTDFHPFLH